MMSTVLDGGMASQRRPENVRAAEVTPSNTIPHEPNQASVALVAALREGDEQAFASLVQQHHAAMLNTAMHYVPSRAAAEEVVQETWIAVLKGIGQFEARSSLKTWIFRILINRAKTCWRREGRSVPFSSMGGPADDSAEPSVDPARFADAEHPTWPHHWRTPPRDWGESPEEKLLSAEAQDYIRRAIDGLPDAQRGVITLRDIEGWAPEAVCETLMISEGNQRVLLHRARSKVRQALEQYFETKS
jgi:RNA polymerase sigma-70 factor (ECF subfamily)